MYIIGSKDIGSISAPDDNTLSVELVQSTIHPPQYRLPWVGSEKGPFGIVA
jgi:hypothetical protein